MRLNILIGGKAGQGINKISGIVADILSKHGYFIFNYRDYPSLIRGGHNFNILSISDEKIGSFESRFDGIISLDDKTLELHKNELKDNGFIVSYESFEEHKINLNMALAGALTKILGLDLEVLLERIRKEFEEESVEAAKRGYESQEKKYDFIFSEFETEEDLIKGLDFVFKIPKPFKPQVNKLAYYLNYEITDRALKEGKIKITDVASMDSENRVLQTVPEKEVRKYLILYYYGLLGKRLIPNALIRHMFKNKFHEKHPMLLSKFSGYLSKFDGMRYSAKSMLQLIARGEFNYIYNRLVNKRDYF